MKSNESVNLADVIVDVLRRFRRVALDRDQAFAVIEKMYCHERVPGTEHMLSVSECLEERSDLFDFLAVSSWDLMQSGQPAAFGS